MRAKDDDRQPDPQAAARRRAFVSRVTRARLDRARAFANEHASALLLVGANRECADDLAREALPEAGASFGIERISLAQLLARLARPVLAEADVAPASTLATEAMAARVAFEADRQGLLPRLGRVRGFPGFPRVLAGTLRDLRLAEIGAVDVAGSGEDVREIAALLDLFERELAKARLADRAEIVRLAIRAIERPEHVALRTLAMLFLDVPIRSTLEHRFVEALWSGSPHVLVTVPQGDEETLRAVGSIEGVTIETLDGSMGEVGSDLARLRRFLFSDDEPPAGAAEDGTVSTFSAPGEARECIEIARAVLDAARSGVGFDEVAVLLRDPAVYSPLLETAFRRAGIPAYFARGTRHPDPSGRAFLALLSCRADRLSARRFAEYLSFAQVPALDEQGAPPENRDVWVGPDDETLATTEPVQLSLFDPPPPEPPDADEAPAIEGTLRAPWRWEEYLVEAAVIGGGKDRWVRRLRGLENEFQRKIQAQRREDPESSRLAAIARDLTNLGHLRRFALPVIDLLDALPSDAPWASWLLELRRLAPMVLRRPERVLAVLGDLEPMGAVGPVTIHEVREVLAERLGALEKEPPTSRYGRVFVATLEQARGRSFRVVVVPGLAERLFPQRPREDPLLLDVARSKLSAGLPTQEDRVLAERQLLRLAVGAAEERVIVSYPRIEVSEARARVPSFYLLDVVRAVRGRIPDFETLEREAARTANAWLSWPAPPTSEAAIDAVEHDLAVLGALLEGGPATEAKGRARYLLELNAHLARSLRARYMRWRWKDWTAADGIVRASEAIAPILAAHRPALRAYSATGLQHFAACPYRFLLAAIHQLEPRPEAVPLIQMDALTRGSLFHAIQAEVFRQLRAMNLLPVAQVRLADAEAVLERTVTRLAADFREELAPAIPRIWEDEVEGLRADLRLWIRRLVDESATWTPRHFELSFGLGRPSEPDADVYPEVVTLPGGWKLRGAVDLVEEHTGDGSLRVTDHKTGRDYTHAGLIIGGGETLQPVLYGLAVQNIFRRDVRESRLYFATTRGGFVERVVPLGDRAKQYGMEVLEIVDRAITEGMLVAAPRHEACRFCDFRTVCGPEEERRTRTKSRAPRHILDLEKLRTLS